jgi:hypothetical protein
MPFAPGEEINWAAADPGPGHGDMPFAPGEEINWAAADPGHAPSGVGPVRADGIGVTRDTPGDFGFGPTGAKLDKHSFSSGGFAGGRGWGYGFTTVDGPGKGAFMELDSPDDAAGNNYRTWDTAGSFPGGKSREAPSTDAPDSGDGPTDIGDDYDFSAPGKGAEDYSGVDFNAGSEQGPGAAVGERGGEAFDWGPGSSGDASGDYDASCYLTTAACDILGKPDDCAELVAFRRLRDELLDHRATRWMVKKYYRDAPSVAIRMRQHPRRIEIAEKMFSVHIPKVMAALRKKNTQMAARLYYTMTKWIEGELTCRKV